MPNDIFPSLAAVAVCYMLTRVWNRHLDDKQKYIDAVKEMGDIRQLADQMAKDRDALVALRDDVNKIIISNGLKKAGTN